MSVVLAGEQILTKVVQGQPTEVSRFLGTGI